MQCIMLSSNTAGLARQYRNAARPRLLIAGQPAGQWLRAARRQLQPARHRAHCTALGTAVPPRSLLPSTVRGALPFLRCTNSRRNQRTETLGVVCQLKQTITPKGYRIAVENRTLTADRAFYVPGAQEDSWNKVRFRVQSSGLHMSNACRLLSAESAVEASQRLLTRHVLLTGTLTGTYCRAVVRALVVQHRVGCRPMATGRGARSVDLELL